MNKLKYLIYLTLTVTFVLINLGGFVHNTGSSLACPDWPLCYGELMPKMEGGILIEHSHRLLGALVGFLTILISFFSAIVYSRKSKIFKSSLLSLFLVIIQGILGGLTVIYKLPTIISTMHLGLSMIFFGSLIYLIHLIQISNIKVKELSSKTIWNQGIKKHSAILLLAVYGQMILGASMRHLGLGSVCGTSWSNAFSCFDLLSGKKSFFPESFQAMFHMGHRYVAYLLAFYIFYCAYTFIKTFKKNKEIPFWNAIRFKLMSLPVLVLFQIKLGLLSVATNLGIAATTLHLGGAALVFIFTWKLFLEITWINKNVKFENKRHDFIFDMFSMSKPRLSSLVIFTAGIGIFLSPGNISAVNAVLGIVFTTLLVGGACTLNCYLERDIDKKMARTADRPLAANRINPNIAFLFGFSMCVVAVLGLYKFTNEITTILGIIATLFYVLFYTPFKKVSSHAVFVGAIPGAMPPLMGHTIVTNEIQLLGVILFLLLFLWQIPHFMAISMRYKEDYEGAGFKVFPNTAGEKSTVWRIMFYTLSLIAVSSLPYFFYLTKSPWYLIGTLLLGAFSTYLALQGFKTSDYKPWARKYFLSTLVYLPVQMSLMIGLLN